MRCRTSACHCGAKHISKLKVLKTEGVKPILRCQLTNFTNFSHSTNNYNNYNNYYNYNNFNFHPNFTKCFDAEVFCTFSLRNVLRATAAPFDISYHFIPSIMGCSEAITICSCIGFHALRLLLRDAFFRSASSANALLKRKVADPGRRPRRQNHHLHLEKTWEKHRKMEVYPLVSVRITMGNSMGINPA